MRDQDIYQSGGLRTTEKIMLLFIGGGIGAVLALLLTPKSGEDLRANLAGATRKSLEKGRETAGQIGGRAGEYYGTAREKAGELYDVTKERAGGLAEQVREAAERPRGTFSAAFEAAKQAYYEEKRRSEPGSISEGRPSYPYELGEAKSEK